MPDAGASSPGRVLDVVTLTADAGLLSTLREAAGPEHALWHAPSADAAVDLLVGGRCGILIADLGCLRGDPTSLLERLQSQFPELVLMATGRRDEEGAVAALVTRGLIYRFLHKPVSPARANLFLAAATRRYHELRDIEPLGMATVRTMAAQPHVGKIAAAIAVAALLAAGFLLWRSAERSAPVAIERSQPAAPTTDQEIADRLARAQIAYATGRLDEPRDDNALDYYRAVLALQPDHAVAKTGAARVIATLEGRIEEALRARNASQGALSLKALQRAQPDHPRLDALRAQLLAISRSIGTARGVGGPGATETSSTERPPAGLPIDLALADEPSVREGGVSADALADNADALALISTPDEAPASLNPEDIERVVRLREHGALIAPADENAYEKFMLIRNQYPDAEEVRTEQQRLAFALLERARTMLAARDVDGAAAFLDRTELLVPGMSITRTLQQQLSVARSDRDFSTNIVPAGSLKRVHEIAPVYPREAARERLAGWVDVEFTITPDGSTTDLVVRSGDHVEAFGKAALDSVSKWRFEPVTRNGEPVAQRAILRVRFALK